jgi:catechol 2,3-dioxygenase
MNRADRPNLNHMGIFVWDLKRMEEFYTKALGLLVTDRGTPNLFPGELVFLSGVSTRHHQLVLSSGRPPDATFSVVMQMSFVLKSLQSLRETVADALRQGAQLYGNTNHGNSWSSYFKDPEGNMIEVYVETPFYVAQPFAQPLDLAKPDSEILAETERLCRQASSFKSREDWEAAMAGRLADAP